MSRAIMAYYISLLPARMCPGPGFCPLPLSIRGGGEVASEVGDETAGRNPIELESVVRPGEPRSKGRLPLSY